MSAPDQSAPSLRTLIEGEPGYKRLTVLIGSHDHAHHRSLTVEILRRARRADLDGATAIAGVEGSGRSGHRHRAHLFSDDTPISIVIVDRGEKIDRFVEEHGELFDRVVVHVDDVRARRA